LAGCGEKLAEEGHPEAKMAISPLSGQVLRSTKCDFLRAGWLVAGRRHLRTAADAESARVGGGW